MKTTLLVSVIILCLSSTLSFAQKNVFSAQQRALLEMADEEGLIPVIIDLNIEFRAVGDSDPGLHAQQRREIAAARESILQRNRSTRIENLKIYNNLPHIALTTDRAGLEALMRDPMVKAVHLDELSTPQMNVSNEIIGSPEVWNIGLTGEGIAVAVLDTGIDSAHPHFNGQVIAEACFSSNTFDSTSLCPNGTNTQTGPGAGMDCNTSISGCGHGTHVAGTVAGSSMNEGREIKGVAPDANLIAIQVFSRFPSSYSACGFTDCVLSYTSDQIAALDWLFDQRNTYNIASANMSLGGGEYTTICDGDTRKTAIDKLRTADIATVISSGNNSFKYAMGAPACISTAVSVGSTRTGKDNINNRDVVSSFSNSANFLDLLAPGQLIESSIPGGNYAEYQGTSMAAPHVAGAWALYRQAYPEATVVEALDAFKNSGVPITDINSITKPRIQVDAAIQVPVISAQPESVSLTLPADVTTSVSLAITNDGDTNLNYTLSDMPNMEGLLGQGTNSSITRTSIQSGRSEEMGFGGNNGMNQISSIKSTNSTNTIGSYFTYHAGGQNGRMDEEITCWTRIVPADWANLSNTALYTVDDEGSDGGPIFGKSVRLDIAYAQWFEIAEPTELAGAEYMILKLGETGNVVFTVWDFATRDVLTEVSVPMSSLPEGTNTVFIHFDEILQLTDDILIGARVDELGPQVPNVYRFGNYSSTFGDAVNSTTWLLESDNQWLNLDPVTVEIAVFGCTSAGPTFTVNYLPNSGTITSGSSDNINLTINTANMVPGVYNRNVVVNSIAPNAPALKVPITITIPEPITASLPGPNEGWRLIGTPALNVTNGELFDSVWTQGFPGAKVENGVPNIYIYDEVANSYNPPNNASNIVGSLQNSSFDVPGHGVLAYIFGDDNYDGVQDAWPKVMVINESPYGGSSTRELSLSAGVDRGWHLVANPYPFSIAWSTLFADAQNINANAYIWDSNKTGGAEFVDTGIDGGHSGIIAPFQGFWIQAIGENSSIQFAPALEAAESGTILSEREQLLFELAVSGQDRESSTFFMYDEVQSEDPLRNNVVRKFSLSPDFFQLVSLDTDERGLRVQYLPTENTEPLEIPLHLRTTEPGDFTLNVNQFPVITDGLIHLLDNQTGRLFEVNQDFAYTFTIDDESVTSILNSDGERITDPLEFVMKTAALTTTGKSEQESRFTLIFDHNFSTNIPETELAATIELMQNYPNPFNPTTIVTYQLPETQHVQLNVYDITGRQVATLVNEPRTTGSHTITFDARNLASGVYVYRLQVGGKVISRKLTLIK